MIVAALAVFASSLALALCATPLAARAARRLGIVDHPDRSDRPGARKTHARPTPPLGGAAIFLAFALPVGAGARALDQAPQALPFLAGAAVMFATGLFDDLRKATFRPRWKLLGQIAAAAIAVWGGARADVLGAAVPNAILSALWIVTIANAMNFLDHADGVAAGVGLIATGLFLWVALALDQTAIACALAALAGAQAGFLAYNFPPASVFLGDAGALTIGYALGALTLLEAYVTRGSPGLLPVLLPPIVLALPLFDMAAVVLARALSRRPIYEGDRNHLHHRLVRLGMSPRQATLTVYLATFALGAGAIALPTAPLGAALAILAQSLATMALVAALMFFGSKRAPP